MSARIARDNAINLARLVDTQSRRQSMIDHLNWFFRRWRMSWDNAWLVRHQFPNATEVHGRTDWMALGRKVKRGAKPITIVAPNRWKKGGFPFKDVDVYDKSQTTPLPNRSSSQQATAMAPESLARSMIRFQSALALLQIPYRVIPRSQWSSQNTVGRADRWGIQVVEGLGRLDHLATMVHECAHHMLHTMPRSDMGKPARPITCVSLIDRINGAYELCEAEAEGTAYIVLTALGHPPPSVQYLAHIGANGVDVLRAMRRMGKAARVMLHAMEGRPMPERKTAQRLKRVA